MVEILVPADVGIANPKFARFRPNQAETAFRIIGSRERFSVLNAPPGTGKSLCYAVAMEMLEARSCVLTFTKALQLQLVEDFPGCVNIMGMGNYPCLKDGDFCDTGSCLLGHECDHHIRKPGNGDCHFYSQVAKARQAEMVCSNYAFWHMGMDLGKFDFLILDEVHKLIEVMTSLLDVGINPEQLKRYCGVSILNDIPNISDDISVWCEWLPYVSSEISKSRMKGEMKLKTSVRALQTMREISSLSGYLFNDPDNWLVTDKDGYGFGNRYAKDRKHNPRKDTVKFSPLWPGRYFESVLFKGIPKVLLVSATVTKSTLKFLGFGDKDGRSYDFMELPSLFEPENRPFIYIKSDPRVRIDFKTKPQEFRKLVRRSIDRVIKDRLDRKGIIHCRSFRWGNRLIEESLLPPGMFMINHTWNTRDVVQDFKDREPPCVLVSPSIESGQDFSGDHCRYQMILKVPFADRRTDIMQRRCKVKGFAHNLVVQAIKQMYGRSTRSVIDWSEVFIFDLHWHYFYKKQKWLFADWFREAYSTTGVIPQSMEGLIQ